MTNLPEFHTPEPDPNAPLTLREVIALSVCAVLVVLVVTAVLAVSGGAA